jgi:hypothetical protein
VQQTVWMCSANCHYFVQQPVAILLICVRRYLLRDAQLLCVCACVCVCV